MYFVSEQHRKNFEALIERFGIRSSSEYLSAAYVSAHPEIYYKINWAEQDSPISWFMTWEGDDDNGQHVLSHTAGTLSSSYLQLARAAVEMFTARDWGFDLVAFLGNAGDELFRVYVQAMELRRGRAIIFS